MMGPPLPPPALNPSSASTDHLPLPPACPNRCSAWRRWRRRYTRKPANAAATAAAAPAAQPAITTTLLLLLLPLLLPLPVSIVLPTVLLSDPSTATLALLLASAVQLVQGWVLAGLILAAQPVLGSSVPLLE